MSALSINVYAKVYFITINAFINVYYIIFNTLSVTLIDHSPQYNAIALYRRRYIIIVYRFHFQVLVLNIF